MASVLTNVFVPVDLRKYLNDAKQSDIRSVSILYIAVVADLFERKFVRSLVLLVSVVSEFEGAIGVRLTVVQLPHELVSVGLLLAAEEAAVFVRLVVDDVSDLINESGYLGLQDKQDLLEVLDLSNHDNHVLSLAPFHDLEFA